MLTGLVVLVVDDIEDIDDGGGEDTEAKLAWGEWICGGGGGEDNEGCVVEGVEGVEPGCFLFCAPLNRLAASWFWGKGSSVSCMFVLVWTVLLSFGLGYGGQQGGVTRSEWVVRVSE